MHPAASRRAGARLLAFLTAPTTTRAVERTSCPRARNLHQQRCVSSTAPRWQQPTPSATTTPSPSRPSQTPLPTQATQSPSASHPTQNNTTAEKVQHELSPSDESEPLRALDETPATLDADSAQVDWTRSFHGLSSTPFTPEQAAILQQEIPFDDIEIKPDGIIYLPEIKYRRILNRAFGPGGWGLAPRGETIVTDKLVTREYGLVAGGRLISIARGEQQYFDASGIPTATEGCKSNALMRCCKDLGIASELWDPRFIKRFMRDMGRELMVEHQTTKKRRKHFMRKDDELKYPFREVPMGGNAAAGARR